MSIDVERAFREDHEYVVLRTRRLAQVSREDAEDATSFAFLQLSRFAHALGDNNLRGWLSVVAYNEALRVKKRDRRFRTLPIHVPIGDAGANPRETDLLERTPFALQACAPDTYRYVEARDTLAQLARLHPFQRGVLGDQMAGLTYRERAAKHGQTYTWVDRHTKEGKRALGVLVA